MLRGPLAIGYDVVHVQAPSVDLDNDALYVTGGEALVTDTALLYANVRVCACACV